MLCEYDVYEYRYQSTWKEGDPFLAIFPTDTAASLKLALLFTKGHFHDTSACLHSEHSPALTHAVIKTYTLEIIALRDISASTEKCGKKTSHLDFT